MPQTDKQRKAAFDVHSKIVRDGRARLKLDELKKSGKYKVTSDAFYAVVTKYIPDSPVTGHQLNDAYMLARDLWVYDAKLPPAEEAMLRYQLQHAARYGALDLED